MKFSTNKKGNALVDLIIGIVILGLVSISVVGAYTSLISMVTNAFRNSQTSWFGNSVMEIYSAKDFDDIAGVDDFILPQFPGYTADITVTPKDIDLSTSTFDGGNEESQYKEIIVAANNVSDNSVTLKTIISVPVEESGGAGGAGLGTFYTFTNCGQEGRTGPSQEQCNSEYGEGVVTVDNGIQEWIVPADGTYSIEAWGAAATGTRAGHGIKVKGNFVLNQGNVIKILVGQMGVLFHLDDIESNTASGGGGGTFVWNSNIGIPSSSNYPMIAAGGGGGGSGTSGNNRGDDGNFITNGTVGRGSDLGPGGTDGGGGGCGLLGGNFFDGVGGAGWHGDGNSCVITVESKSVKNGGTGGEGYHTHNNEFFVKGAGGFGGGGGNGAYNHNGTGGGGGGYSGGGGGGNDKIAGTYQRGSGGGGGSYCDGECNQAENATGDTWEYNEGHGKVIITVME